MIIIYPMLTSRAVSENIVPGIAKTIESYIIINAQNSLVSNPALKKQNYNFKIKGKNLTLKEDVTLTEGVEEFGGGTKNKRRVDQAEADVAKAEIELRKAEAEAKALEAVGKALEAKAKLDAANKEATEAKARLDNAKAFEKEEKERRAGEKDVRDEEDRKKEELKAKAKKAQVSINMKDNRAISIEPTYMTVNTEDEFGNPVNKFIGIKVVPLRVKSDEKLSRLIMHDIQLKNFNAILISLGRRVMKWTYRFLDKWSRKFRLGGLTPSGDPRRDMLMGRTGHKGEGFILLSKTEDIDEIFLSDASKINRLFSLGWGNIVIVDDINRMAYFCMKSFKGVCTGISYAMIYQNFGQLQVYSSLEDAKRQNSSLFKIRKRTSQVFAEWTTEYRRGKYISEDK